MRALFGDELLQPQVWGRQLVGLCCLGCGVRSGSQQSRTLNSQQPWTSSPGSYSALVRSLPPPCLPSQGEWDFPLIPEFPAGGGEDKCSRQRGFPVCQGTRYRDGAESQGCRGVNCREPKRGPCPVVGRIRTCAGKPQWISSPSPSPLGHNYLLQP